MSISREPDITFSEDTESDTPDNEVMECVIVEGQEYVPYEEIKKRYGISVKTLTTWVKKGKVATVDGPPHMKGLHAYMSLADVQYIIELQGLVELEVLRKNIQEFTEENYGGTSAEVELLCSRGYEQDIREIFYREWMAHTSLESTTIPINLAFARFTQDIYGDIRKYRVSLEELATYTNDRIFVMISGS